MDQRVKIERYKMVANKYTPLFEEVTTPVKDYPSFEQKDCRIVCDPVEKDTSLCMIKITAASTVYETPADALEAVMEEQMIKCVSKVSIVLTEKSSDEELVTSYKSSINRLLVKVDSIERVANGQGGYDFIIDISDESKYSRLYAPGTEPGTGCFTITPIEAFYSNEFYISAIQINGVMTKYLAETQVAALLKWREKLIKEWDEFYAVNTAETDQYGQWITKEPSPNYIFAQVAPLAQTLAITPTPILTDFGVGVDMGFPIPKKKLVSGDPTLDVLGVSYIEPVKPIPATMDGEIVIHFDEVESSNPPSYTNNFRWELMDDLKNNRKALIRVDEIYHEDYKYNKLETAKFYIFTFVNIQIIQGTIPFTVKYSGYGDEYPYFGAETRYYTVTDAKVKHLNEINVIKRVDGVINTKEFVYKIYVGDNNTTTTTETTVQEFPTIGTCGCK